MELHGGDSGEPTRRGRRKKMQVIPGQSISQLGDTGTTIERDQPEERPSTSVIPVPEDEEERKEKSSQKDHGPLMQMTPTYRCLLEMKLETYLMRLMLKRCL